MSGFPVRWRVFALVLGVALVQPCLAPAEVHAAAARPGITAESMPASWDLWVTRIWGFLAGAAEKEGCGIDPNGHCCKGTAPAGRTPPKGGGGCAIDSHGQCVQGAAPARHRLGKRQEGCGIDPNGIKCG
jgi:hypothetical protein